jgi:hypothetical protein
MKSKNGGLYIVKNKITYFIAAILTLMLMATSCTPTSPNVGNDSVNSGSYQLSTSITPNGGGTISPGGGMYKKGTSVTLVATPSNYFIFNGWAGDVSGNINPLTVKIDSNKNIVASFIKKTSKLQLNVNIPGSGTLDPKSGDYEAGVQVKITETPATGYRFDHWGGSASGNSTQISVLMDTDKTITAYFVQQYTLKVASNPSEGGTISIGNGVYDVGTQVKISGTQQFPYAFGSWSGADNAAVNPTTVTMDSDKNVSCNFVKLTAGDWKTENNSVYRGGTNTFPIELNQYDYVEGSIGGYLTHVWIQDPSGATVKDLGSVSQTNFLITALVPGRYSIILQNTDQGTLKYDYAIKYRIYRK